jgi:predicted TPR repeat methyltransferase
VNRKERRAQEKQGPRTGGGPRRPPAVSDMLLRHAGQAGPASADFDKIAAELAAQQAAKPIVRALSGQQKQEGYDRQIADLERRLDAEPRSLALWLSLAELQRKSKRHDAAVAAYRKALEIEPGRGDIQHMIDALSGERTPGRASDAYVTAQFDSFAERYDETLRTWLDYKGPEIVHRAAMAALGPFPRLQEIIDLGCGTGLNAPLFAGIAARLDGVDLSPRMIEKARAGGRYDELVVAEIVEFLAAKPAAYTLALASDVLVYFGDLNDLFAAVFAALKPGGVFVGTVEAGAGVPFKLQESGRYAHDDNYVRASAIGAGFEVVSASDEVLRTDSGQPINGRVYALKKPR